MFLEHLHRRRHPGAGRQGGLRSASSRSWASCGCPTSSSRGPPGAPAVDLDGRPLELTDDAVSRPRVRRGRGRRRGWRGRGGRRGRSGRGRRGGWGCRGGAGGPGARAVRGGACRRWRGSRGRRRRPRTTARGGGPGGRCAGRSPGSGSGRRVVSTTRLVFSESTDSVRPTTIGWPSSVGEDRFDAGVGPEPFDHRVGSGTPATVAGPWVGTWTTKWARCPRGRRVVVAIAVGPAQLDERVGPPVLAGVPRPGPWPGASARSSRRTPTRAVAPSMSGRENRPSSIPESRFHQ